MSDGLYVSILLLALKNAFLTHLKTRHHTVEQWSRTDGRMLFNCSNITLTHTQTCQSKREKQFSRQHILHSALRFTAQNLLQICRQLEKQYVWNIERKQHYRRYNLLQRLDSFQSSWIAAFFCCCLNYFWVAFTAHLSHPCCLLSYAVTESTQSALLDELKRRIWCFGPNPNSKVGNYFSANHLGKLYFRSI